MALKSPIQTIVTVQPNERKTKTASDFIIPYGRIGEKRRNKIVVSHG